MTAAAGNGTTGFAEDRGVATNAELKFFSRPRAQCLHWVGNRSGIVAVIVPVLAAYIKKQFATPKTGCQINTWLSLFSA